MVAEPKFPFFVRILPERVGPGKGKHTLDGNWTVGGEKRDGGKPVEPREYPVLFVDLTIEAVALASTERVGDAIAPFETERVASYGLADDKGVLRWIPGDAVRVVRIVYPPELTKRVLLQNEGLTALGARLRTTEANLRQLAEALSVLFPDKFQVVDRESELSEAPRKGQVRLFVPAGYERRG